MYISLHNRSAYSFGSSLIMPQQLAIFADYYKMPAVALTDLAGLYGAVTFQQMCEEVGVKPIFGAELPIAVQVSHARGASDSDGNCIPAALLAMSLRGYGHLCRLISRHHVEGRPLRTNELTEGAEGLICILGSAAVNGCEKRSSNQLHTAIGNLRGAFCHRLYVELALHRGEDLPIHRKRAQLADELGIPVVATGESRCLRRDQQLTLRALSSIGTLTLLDAPHPDKPEGHWHLRSPEEMERLFQRRPDALANTFRIAEQCDVRLDLDHNRFPSYAPPDGRSSMQYLRELCVAGCRRRYLEDPPQRGIGGTRPAFDDVLRRLDRELAIIDQVHYAEYFLVFQEIVEYCRSRGIATLARGSAADSLVCYALGVSHACPFRFDLPFDRFVNPERAKFSKMADIDLDLPWDQRDEVIRWVYTRWGDDHVAMIGATNTFHARAAVAELGKVFGLPAHEVHRATKLLPYTSAWKLPEVITRSPEARDLPTQEEPYRTILAMAGELEGLPRHWSMHPCGLVVSPEPMTDLVPVQPSPKGPLVAQYEMDPIEDLGFVKIDLLGQAGLSVLRDSVAEVERTDGVWINLDRDVDYSDAATWDLIADGEARGVHHIESPAMTSLLVECNCRDIDCLTTIVAIIRPGAANQGKKEQFARRYQGLDPPEYAHPSVVPVLEKTFGLMVFEEHILQIAVEFAGMNLGRADVLRRALNKENRPLIVEMKAEFHASALLRSRTDAEIDAVWSLVEGFAGFMFNKAHSAEYAVEAFQGAWLKLRRPAHYLAAILSNYRGFYANSPTLPQILYVMEALRRGIALWAPCINRSRRRFAVEYSVNETPVELTTAHRLLESIRIPISHIHGLSEALAERWWSERQAASFTSPEDFLRRCRPGEAEVQALLDAGAFDIFGESRPAMFWRMRRALRSTAAGTRSLLIAADLPQCAFIPVQLTDPSPRDIARREMDLLGFPLRQDPLTYLGTDDKGRTIDWSRYVPVSRLAEHRGRRVTVCGLMVADRINATLRGDLMKFVTLGDRTGFVETALFPGAYRRFGYLTVSNPVLAATGTVQAFDNGRGVTLRVERVTIPEKAAAAAHA